MSKPVYVYQADLLCEECGEKVRVELTAAGKAPANPDDECAYDSDEYPNGPTDEGEADSPWHCSACGVFLETRLTNDGAEYVLDKMLNACHCFAVSKTTMEWCRYYERHDSRVSLTALAERGLTIEEILTAMKREAT